MPGTVGVHAHGFAARMLARRMLLQHGLAGRIARNHGFDGNGFHHQALARHQEGEPLAIGRLEGRLDVVQPAEGHGQGGIGALIAHMHVVAYLHRAGTDLLALKLGLGRVAQRIQRLRDQRQGRRRQRHLHRLFTDDGLVRQAHAVGAEHAGQRMHEHTGHAQGIGHQAGMLAARAAKALQRVARHVIAARHADLLDGVGHLLHGDADEAFGHFLGPAPRLHRQFIEARPDGLAIEPLVGGRAEHAGEVAGLDLAHHHVRIGHGQGPATAVAHGAGVGTRALRAHAKARAVIGQYRAATGGHRVDAHHRRAHAHTGHLGLELALEGASVVADIGGGAAHVEADDLVVPGQPRRAGHAHDAAGRPAQDGILALEAARIGQPAGGLHEKQPHARHLASHLLYIAAQDGREVGIDHRGVAPAHELHQRAGLVRGADLRESRLPRNARRNLLVPHVAVAMHEDDGHAAQAPGMGLQQRGVQVQHVQFLLHFPTGIHALKRLHHLAVQQLGQLDMPVEQARAVLVGNAQRITKAPRGHQQRGLALALQQRIGGHRGAHLHALHKVRRDRLAGLEAQQVADAGHGRITVLLGVFRQQLVRGQAAIGPLAHDVGESAAAVYPELPAPVMGSGAFLHGVGTRLSRS